MQSDGGVQQQQHNTLLTADQLSRLTGNAGDANNPGQQQLASSHSHYDMQANASTETRDGPKLEDFLGGASLGGQYSEREAAQQQAQLDSLYYNPTGGTPNYAAHRSDTASRINVNLPYSSTAGGGGSLHDVPPSYHVAYGGGVPDGSSLTQQHAYDHPHSRAHNDLQETSNSLQLAGSNRMHAQNLLQAALDQSNTAELLSDCALQQQPPSATGDEFGLKTWLRHQAAAEKAGQQQQQQQRGLNALATLQPLTLSMSAGSHQSSVSTPVHGSGGQLVPAGESPTGPEPRKRGAGRAGSKEPSPRKSIDTFGQRTSVYRGVTR